MEKKKISREDYLLISNIQLKMEKIQLELQVLHNSVQQKVGQRDKLVQEMMSIRSEFLEKYGVDLQTAKIEEDGSYEV